MSSNAPAAVPIGEHLIRDASLEAFFIAALSAYPGGYVVVERWEDFFRQPDNSLEKEWAWKVTVGGALHGYRANEFMLDLAVPLRPNVMSDPDTLERRGRVGRLLGIGQAPAPTPEHQEAIAAVVEEARVEETKVIQLPVAPAVDGFAPEDPNSFPG